MAWGRRTAFNATRAFAPPEATAPGADEERLRARTLKPSAPPHGGSNSRDGGILVFQYNAMAGRALTGEAGFWLAVLRGHWPSDLAQTDYFSLGSTVFAVIDDRARHASGCAIARAVAGLLIPSRRPRRTTRLSSARGAHAFGVAGGALSSLCDERRREPHLCRGAPCRAGCAASSRDHGGQGRARGRPLRPGVRGTGSASGGEERRHDPL